MYKLQKTVDPTILIIFGATGELSRQRLIPALYRLFDHELLPKIFFVVGFARSVFSHREFRKTVRPQEIDAKTWNRFSKKIYYQPGNFTNHQDFQKLATLLPNLEGQGHNLPHRQASCANWLFYFATLPSHYKTISHELKKSGLLVGCTIHKRQTRVIIEKPFGQDLESAKKLDTTLHKYFGEGQIYRIDHYLGKETVQNLLTVRFANSIFEPIWNHNFIDHVQINALEGIGVGNRGSYYEQAGALRDFVQNHMMQLLSLITMEPPSDLSTKAIRDERAKVIRAINLPSASELQDSLVIGQYQGYCKEPNVSPRSRVETFAALRLFIENSRWVKVPFYLRTGKRVDVPYKTTEISIHFKYPMQNLFGGGDVRPNVLTFTVQHLHASYGQISRLWHQASPRHDGAWLSLCFPRRDSRGL